MVAASRVPGEGGACCPAGPCALLSRRLRTGGGFDARNGESPGGRSGGRDGAARIRLRFMFMFCSLIAMQYIHSATRPLLPNDAIREAMLAFVFAFPAFWALGEMLVALGS